MSVTLQLPTVLAKLADGQRTLEARGATLGDVVTDVSTRFPGLAPRLRDADGKPYPFVTFYVNDDDARLWLFALIRQALRASLSFRRPRESTSPAALGSRRCSLRN